jgi:hypothetical protein
MGRVVIPDDTYLPLIQHQSQPCRWLFSFYKEPAMTFEQWMQAVDVVVGDIAFGLSIHDLPDIDFRARYDAGEMAQTAAEAALASADFPFEDLDFLT